MNWIHHPLVADAGWGSLVTIVIFALLSGIGNWIQKRQQEREEAGNPSELEPRRPSSLPPSLPPTSLEEELRRLLQGDRPRPVAPAPVPPPPIPQALAPQARYSEAAPALEEAEGPQVTLPPLSKAAQGQLEASQLSGRVAARLRQASETLGRLPDSEHAAERVDALDETVRRRMLAGLAQSARVGTAASGREPSLETAAVLAALRQPQSVRQAFLLSVILAPPRGLDAAS